MFRKIDRWGNVSPRALDPAAINAIVKQRAEMAGLEPADYSAHGLRSGYLTEAANRGIPLPEAMEQSRTGQFSRQRAITTTRQGAPARRRACCSNRFVLFHHCKNCRWYNAICDKLRRHDAGVRDGLKADVAILKIL